MAELAGDITRVFRVSRGGHSTTGGGQAHTSLGPSQESDEFLLAALGPLAEPIFYPPYPQLRCAHFLEYPEAQPNAPDKKYSPLDSPKKIENPMYSLALIITWSISKYVAEYVPRVEYSNTLGASKSADEEDGMQSKACAKHFWAP